jgi:hypothetical protein
MDVLFSLGQIVAAPGVLAALEKAIYPRLQPERAVLHKMELGGTSTGYGCRNRLTVCLTAVPYGTN